MTGQSTFARLANKKIKLMAMLFATWQILVCVLGFWWGSLLIKQAIEMRDLELKLGMSSEESEKQLKKVQRMLFWESSVFYVLILGSMTVLGVIVIRDMRRNRSLQAFFAGFTHELRTPLTSIRLQAESLQDNVENSGMQSGKMHDLVARLMEDTSRLESQVDRTLELARVEGGGGLRLQSINLKSFLDRFKSQYNHYLGKKIQFEIHSNIQQYENLQIEADSAALQIIFKNIFENAIRHSSRAHSEDKIQITLQLTSNENEIYLEFYDHGEGYQGNHKELGELFSKGLNSTGAGVGLYLIKMLMKKMKGTVEFSSQKEKGFITKLILRT